MCDDCYINNFEYLVVFISLGVEIEIIIKKERNIYLSLKIVESAICLQNIQLKQFQQSDYVAIDQLLEERESEIIKQWPPLNDKNINQDLKYLLLDPKYFNYSQKVNEYFAELKNEIISKLDQIHQETINRINTYPIEKNEILKKYLSVSQIDNFKSIVQKMNEKDSFETNQYKCRNFIEEMERNKENSQKILGNLRNQSKVLRSRIDFTFPHTCKEQAKFIIDKIKFFHHKILGQRLQHQRN